MNDIITNFFMYSHFLSFQLYNIIRGSTTSNLLSSLLIFKTSKLGKKYLLPLFTLLRSSFPHEFENEKLLLNMGTKLKCLTLSFFMYIILVTK